MNYLSDRLAQRSGIFYGYWMLPLAMLLQVGSSPGQTFAVSAFTPALLESLDLSQSRLGLAYMLGTLLAAFPLMVVGPISDRLGLKRVACVVVVGLAGACLLASQVSGFLSLLGAFFLLRFLGQGSMSLLSSNTTAMWFRERIGRVSALLSVGSALAFAWVPDVLASSVESMGWRSTYQWTGVWLAGTLLPLLLLFYRNRPEDLGQLVDGASVVEPGSSSQRPHRPPPPSVSLAVAIRSVSYYVIGLANVVWAMAGTGILFYLFTLSAERGMDDADARRLFKILAGAMLIAQLVGGVIADFLKLNRLFGLGTGLIAISLCWLAFDTSLLGAQGFAAMFGAGQGLLISVTGVIMVRFYGREHLGSIRGTIWCGTVAGSGCGPLVMGAFMDHVGSYDPAIRLFAAGMLPLALAAWFVRPPAGLGRPAEEQPLAGT